MSEYICNRKRKIKCVVCGKEFVTMHPCKKTCSLECSMVRKEVAARQIKENYKRYYAKSRKVK